MDADVKDPLDELDNPVKDESQEEVGRLEQPLPSDESAQQELNELAKAAEEQEPQVQEPEQQQVVEQPQPVPQQQAQPQEAQDPQQSVPLPALQDEREKRQKAEAQLDVLTKQMAQLQQYVQQPQQPQQQVPQQTPEPVDPLVDPQGFAKQLEEIFDNRLNQVVSNMETQRLNMSERRVRSGPDADLVDDALQAFSQAIYTTPGLEVQIKSDPEPWQAMVDWHKQQKMQSTIGGDLDAYVEQKLNERLQQLGVVVPNKETAPAPVNGGLNPNPQPQVVAPQSQAAPGQVQLPASLAAAAGSAGGTPQETFDAEADPLDEL